MDLIGMRGTLALCIVGYVLYMAANVYAVWGTLVTGAVIDGLAIGPIWTAQSCYIRAVGVHRAKLTGEDQEVIISKFFGVFFLLYQLCKYLLIHSVICFIYIRTYLVEH